MFGVGGEKRSRLSATKRFIEQYPHCCFCAGTRPAATREHMPPKSLFDASYRPDKLVMPACDECNRGTSTADLTAAVVSRWAYSTNEVELSDQHRLIQRLRKQAPEVVNEWVDESGPSLNIRGRQHLREHGVPVPDHTEVVTVGLETIRQLTLFAHKVTLALYFEHFRRPLAGNAAYSAHWRTKEEMHRGVPVSLLERLPKHGTLTQGTWNTLETFEYRHDFNLADGLLGFLARFRFGLFVAGFVMGAEHIPNDADGWVRPGELLQLAHTPQFAKRQ